MQLMRHDREKEKLLRSQFNSEQAEESTVLRRMDGFLSRVFDAIDRADGLGDAAATGRVSLAELADFFVDVGHPKTRNELERDVGSIRADPQALRYDDFYALVKRSEALWYAFAWNIKATTPEALEARLRGPRVDAVGDEDLGDYARAANAQRQRVLDLAREFGLSRNIGRSPGGNATSVDRDWRAELEKSERKRHESAERAASTAEGAPRREVGEVLRDESDTPASRQSRVALRAAASDQPQPAPGARGAESGSISYLRDANEEEYLTMLLEQFSRTLVYVDASADGIAGGFSIATLATRFHDEKLAKERARTAMFARHRERGCPDADELLPFALDLYLRAFVAHWEAQRARSTPEVGGRIPPVWRPGPLDRRHVGADQGDARGRA